MSSELKGSVTGRVGVRLRRRDPDVARVRDSGQDFALTAEDPSGRFIVSDRSATELASHYQRRAPLMIGGGLLSSAGSLFVLLKMVGL